MAIKQSSVIRDYVVRTYIEPARRRGETAATVVIGDVHKALQMHNRVPQVCSALREGRFLKSNELVLEIDGPPSGQSTTVKYIYTWKAGPRFSPANDPILALLGIGKKTFEALGGGEKVINDLRNSDLTDGKE